MTAAAVRQPHPLSWLIEQHVAAIQAAPAREPEPPEPVLEPEPEPEGEWTEAELRLMDGNR